jgi:hypothetical protein
MPLESQDSRFLRRPALPLSGWYLNERESSRARVRARARARERWRGLRRHPSKRNRNKKVVYRSFVTGNYNNITVRSSCNALVNSGKVHPTAVLICPFDTYPVTTAPLSLSNLQVIVGGQNFSQSTLSMTYENFLEQVNVAEQLTSSDFCNSTGLISQGYWEMSKWYFL